jgi:hypothetical protein
VIFTVQIDTIPAPKGRSEPGETITGGTTPKHILREEYIGSDAPATRFLREVEGILRAGAGCSRSQVGGGSETSERSSLLFCQVWVDIVGPAIRVPNNHTEALIFA